MDNGPTNDKNNAGAVVDGMRADFKGLVTSVTNVGTSKSTAIKMFPGDAHAAKVQAMKALQLTKAVADQSTIRQELMSKNSNIWALDSASEEHNSTQGVAHQPNQR